MVDTLKSYRQKWYIKNRKRLLEKSKKYTKENRDLIQHWKKLHKEEIKDYMKNYRQIHKEELSIRRKEYENIHKNKIKEYYREYFKHYYKTLEYKIKQKRYQQSLKGKAQRKRYWQSPKGKFLSKVSSHNHRLRIKGLKIAIIQQVYEDNIKRYGTLTCYLCLKPIEFGRDSLEHKIPSSRGGSNLKDNLDVACQHCNFSKQGKTEEEYRKYIKEFDLICINKKLQEILATLKKE